MFKSNKFKTTAIEYEERGEISISFRFVRKGAGIRLEARRTLAFAEVTTPDKVGFCSFATPSLRSVLALLLETNLAVTN